MLLAVAFVVLAVYLIMWSILWRMTTGGSAVESTLTNSFPTLEKPSLKPSQAEPEIRSTTIRHSTIRSVSGLFRSLQGYLIDGDAQRDGPSAATDELVLVVLGYGEFTESAAPKDTKYLFVPNDLKCIVQLGDKIITIPAKLHTDGTAFQGLKNQHGSLRFPGERLVWISCALGPLSSFENTGAHGTMAGSVRVMNDEFDTTAVPMEWFLSQSSNVQSYSLVECSAPIHHVTGTKWLIEWIEYHKAFGFDHVHLYMHDLPDSSRQVISYYIKEGFVTYHDWSGIPANVGVGKVNIVNWEHGQRAARNDCYLRNRGIASYIAFSDIDELWSYADHDTTFSAGLSFNKKVESRNTVAEKLVYWFESQNNYPQRIGFLFKSVTVPPVAASAFVDAAVGHGWDAKGRRVYLNNDQGTIVGKLQFAEAACEAPYNCGAYHRGRQKYMLKTGHGTLNLYAPLFYHAVNEDYAGIANKHMHQVPVNIGYIRHHAGHFKHSRLGGLYPLNRKHLPLHPVLVSRIARRIHTLPLNSMYIESAPEKFLELDSVNDPWRFAKSSDDSIQAKMRHGIELSQVKALAEKAKRSMMTFDQFGGRLNNQLLSFDWAFRVAKAVGRSLFVKTKDLKTEFWIGWPSTKEEELHDTSMWEMVLLRRNFDFIMDYEEDVVSSYPILERPYQELDPKCVWTDELVSQNPEFKQVAHWAAYVSKFPECSERIHFASKNGLIHSYRTDTNKFGVSYYDFWSAMRPSKYLNDLVSKFISSNLGTAKISLGMHVRSHNSYGAVNVKKAYNSCMRLALKPLDHATRYQIARTTCCKSETPVSPDPAFIWLKDSENLGEIFYKTRHLDKMCNISVQNIIEAADFTTKTTKTKTFQYFLATDHENKAVDKLVMDHGGINFAYDSEKVFQGDPKLQKYPNEGRSQMKRRNGIQGVLIDMLILSKTDVFFGNPGSTLSQVVCFWRFANNKDLLTTELSNICGLILLATGSSTCDDISCTS